MTSLFSVLIHTHSELLVNEPESFPINCFLHFSYSCLRFNKELIDEAAENLSRQVRLSCGIKAVTKQIRRKSTASVFQSVPRSVITV
jgi:hypothetical protein